jgi:uncharacterized protein YdiU (UPF0061 family)
VSKQLKPIPFNNTYAQLGEDFYTRTSPVPVANPGLIIFNHALGEELGLTDTCLALLEGVIERQAALIAQWMQLGFIHGVMNTDNMSIAGETIDYGPCAFMDHYTHEQVYSSIDHHGRYAYNNQPSIGLWNLTRLAETLVPLLADNTDASIETANAALQSYTDLYTHHWLDGMRQRTGLMTPLDEDQSLIEALLDSMATNRADFTLTFHYLSQLAADSTDKDGKARMRAVNPLYIPRNHQIEATIRAAEDEGDFSAFHELYAILQKPLEQQPHKEAYTLPPEPHEIVQQTFCGT